jgi:hypothetical protein
MAFDTARTPLKLRCTLMRDDKKGDTYVPSFLFDKQEGHGSRSQFTVADRSSAIRSISYSPSPLPARVHLPAAHSGVPRGVGVLVGGGSGVRVAVGNRGVDVGMAVDVLGSPLGGVLV